MRHLQGVPQIFYFFFPMNLFEKPEWIGGRIRPVVKIIAALFTKLIATLVSELDEKSGKGKVYRYQPTGHNSEAL